MMQNLFANSPALNHPRSITRPTTLMLSLRWNKEMSVSTISTGHPSPCVLCSCFCWIESKELNQAKDRLKVLQHELACATAVLKVKKASGLESKAAPSKFAPIEARQADNKGTSANVHHSAEIQL